MKHLENHSKPFYIKGGLLKSIQRIHNLKTLQETPHEPTQRQYAEAATKATDEREGFVFLGSRIYTHIQASEPA